MARSEHRQPGPRKGPALARPSRLPSLLGLVAGLAGTGCSAEVSQTSAAEYGAAGATTGTGGSNGQGGASAAGGGTSADPNDVPAGDPKPVDLSGAPIFTRFVRLTHDQWENSVTDLLGLTSRPGLSAMWQEPVLGTTDFSNNELVLEVTNDLWANYQSAAEALAARASGSETALAALYSGTDRDGFITSFGRRAFRRPLDTAQELPRYQALFDAGAAIEGEGSLFAKGAALVIRAMLQSPHFLYRSELQPSGAPLTSYEVASKLSFWLRNTTPDDALLDAAERGELDTAEGAAAVAERMLEEQPAAEMMRRFHAELFHFSRFSNVDKAGVGGYTTALNAELEQASVRFFERIFTQNLGVREILSSTTGYVGPGLAPLYDLAAPAGGMLAEHDLGAERPGFFTQIPFLILYSLNADPDSIHRGVSISLDVLCANPGTPNVVLPMIPALATGETNRERITTLTGECGSCHSDYINPLGFAFEGFDGMGQHRTLDNGEAVDASGRYPFQEGTQTFTDAASLMQIMADSRQAHQCYAKKLASYALQRDLAWGDLPLLEGLGAISMTAASSVKKVMLELVTTAEYRTRPRGTP